VQKISEISQQTLAVAEQKTPSEIARSSISLDEANEELRQYTADVGEILEKTIARANQPPLEPEEFVLRMTTWTEDFLAEGIPRNRLADCYDAAREAHASIFPINSYEITQAWKQIVEKEREAKLKLEARRREEFPVEYCADRNDHISPTGEVKIFSLFTKTDEIVPCRKCRFEDYEKWRKKQVALYGEHQPLTVLQQTNNTPARIIEPDLTPAEVAELSSEFNALVRELVEDAATAEKMIVVFDEGSNRFHHPDSFHKLYRAEDLRRRIKDYRKILEGRAEWAD